MKKNKKGFTLVELMVVVVIIGILVAVAIPVFNAAKANAWKRSCHANQRTIEGAAQSYNAENGAMPANVAALATPNAEGSKYLQSAPKCPRPGSSASTGYTFTNATDGIVADCTGGTDGGADHDHF